MEKKMPETSEEKAAMTEPFVYKRCYKNMKLQAGKQYRYCLCGITKTQPFCDDSHVGTIFEPVIFKAKDQTITSVCLCRRSGAMPYCDSTHMMYDF